MISVTDTLGGAPEGTIAFSDATSANLAFSTPGALSDPMSQMTCFAAGTRIATTRGLVHVELIHAGDHVCTVLGGDTAEVIWTGFRKVDCARHANPRKVWPIVVSAHAFGRGMPSTDLVLSPDHAVFVDDVLIPIRLLMNGRNVRQVLVERISYHHIELARHDVLLANGMPAESYLDAGDRARFSNGGGVIALHPDFSAHAWEMKGCAPLIQTGPVLAAVRKRLGQHAARRARRTLAPGTTSPG